MIRFDPGRLVAAGLLAGAALLLVIVFAVLVFAPVTHSETAPTPHRIGVADITVLRHTYDGAELYTGAALAWQYGYDEAGTGGALLIEMTDAGDGIFRSGFEGASTCP